MKKIWLGTSWKMNKTSVEASRFCACLAEKIATINTDQLQPFIIPPFPYISQSVSDLKHTPVMIGAQNMCWQDAGAFTGEVSPLMIKDCGATLVEIGHSERREMFGETDHSVNLKVQTAIKHGLIPLVCVGDTGQEKQWAVSQESVIRQVKIALYDLHPDEAARVIFAYEPVWAIGDDGVPATEDEAALVHDQIRSTLIKLFGQQQGNRMLLLYGGSVNHLNAKGLLTQPNIDGLFIGRSAWDADNYLALLDIAQS